MADAQLAAAVPYCNLRCSLVRAMRAADVVLTMLDGPVVVEDSQQKTANLRAIPAAARLAPGLFARLAGWLAANAGGARQWTEGSV